MLIHNLLHNSKKIDFFLLELELLRAHVIQKIYNLYNSKDL